MSMRSLVDIYVCHFVIKREFYADDKKGEPRLKIGGYSGRQWDQWDNTKTTLNTQCNGRRCELPIFKPLPPHHINRVEDRKSTTLEVCYGSRSVSSTQSRYMTKSVNTKVTPTSLYIRGW